MGLYCLRALRGLWGFCTREVFGGFGSCGVFAPIFRHLPSILSFYDAFFVLPFLSLSSFALVVFRCSLSWFVVAFSLADYTQKRAQFLASSLVLLPCLASALGLVLLSWLCGLAFGVGWVVGFLSLTDYAQKERAQRFVPCVLSCRVVGLFI